MAAEPRLADHDLLRRAPHQTSCQLADELVLLNVDSGVYYGLDAVGTRVWQLLAEEGSTLESLCLRLIDEYDVDRPTCERDLRDLLSRLLGAGLIEVEARGGSGPA